MPLARLRSWRSSSPPLRSSIISAVHWQRVKNCFSAMTWRRYRSALPASSLSSDSESNTARVGRSCSASSKIARVVSPSSTSDGWKTVYCASGWRLSSEGISSRIRTPSSDQPCEVADGAKLLRGLGEGHVEDRLSAPDALEEELQREGGLAGAGIALEEVEARRASARRPAPRPGRRCRSRRAPGSEAASRPRSRFAASAAPSPRSSARRRSRVRLSTWCLSRWEREPSAAGRRRRPDQAAEPCVTRWIMPSSAWMCRSCAGSSASWTRRRLSTSSSERASR